MVDMYKAEWMEGTRWESEVCKGLEEAKAVAERKGGEVAEYGHDERGGYVQVVWRSEERKALRHMLGLDKRDEFIEELTAEIEEKRA